MAGFPLASSRLHQRSFPRILTEAEFWLSGRLPAIGAVDIDPPMPSAITCTGTAHPDIKARARGTVTPGASIAVADHAAAPAKASGDDRHA